MLATLMVTNLRPSDLSVCTSPSLEGGIMAFDDYGLTQFPGAKTAVDEVLGTLNPRLFYAVPTGGAFLIK